jgi:sulfite reductase (NADPH) flavoprotein alpha-component
LFKALELQPPAEVPHIVPVKLELSKRVILRDEEDHEAAAQYFDSIGTANIPIADIKQLSEENHNRDFISFTLDIGGKLSYEVGDALEIFPVNDSTRVAEFLHAYSSEFDERTVVSLHTFGISREVSVGCLFTNVLDIFGKPTMHFLQQLATFEDDENIRKQMLDKRILKKMTSQQGVTYADLLLEYKSAHPPLAALLSMIPQIKGRAYSITSSPSITPNSIELCILIDTWWCDKGMRYGLTCDMLRKLQVGDAIQCRVKAGSMEPPSHDQPGMYIIYLTTSILMSCSLTIVHVSSGMCWNWKWPGTTYELSS